MHMNCLAAARTAALLLVIAASAAAAATIGQQPPAPPPGQATAGITSAAAVSEWRDKLTAAKALTDDTQRRDALLALMREALKDRDVQPSGTKSPGQVHPDDNRPVPVVNFDVNLQNKKAYHANPDAETRSLATNFGYYFTVKGVAYVVLGPAALDPRGPVFTRLSAGHELFHAEHHVGDPRPLEDRELETWTAMFVKYFHDIHTFRQKWGPLVSYYEQANPVEQKIALDKLVAYYRAPPSSTETKSDSAAVSAAFRDWLARRKKDADTTSSKLVRDLEAAIGSPVPPKVQAVRPDEKVEVSGPVRIATSPDGQRLLISVGDTDAYSVILSNPVTIDAGDWFQSPVTFPSGRVHFGGTRLPLGRLTVTLENGRRLTFYMAGDDLSAADRKAKDAWQARGFAHYPAPKNLDELEKMVFAQK